MLLAVWLACAGRPGDTAGPDTAGPDTAPVEDACEGLPHVYFAWYPRDGMDVLEVLIDRPGRYGLALASDGWTGESCGAHGVCHPVDGDTLALQTVLTPAQVRAGRTTWFTAARFDRWALRMDTGEGTGIDAACVGDGFPGCCTRDSRR